jgi:hypothetical protein
MNEYPSEEDLKRIETWKYKDCYNLFLFIQSLWNKEKGKCTIKIYQVYFGTGGWSGNEEIISALQNNYMIWSLTWQKSERGGAFWFTLPTKKTLKAK